MEVNLDTILNKDTITSFQPDCIRKKTNWSKSNPIYKFDSESFDPNLLLNDIPDRSPKLQSLLDNIRKLDNDDQSRDGKQYKHFIFCDVKSGNNGAHMLASAFIASGYKLGYGAEVISKPIVLKTRQDTPRPPMDIQMEPAIPVFSPFIETVEEGDEKEEDDDDLKSTLIVGGDSPKVIRKKKNYKKMELYDTSKLINNLGNNFYLLASTDVYDQPIHVKMKKQILSNFNQRPSNIHGEEIRFIIMDSGFKEGIDLFDIKYIHIFEPSVNSSDQTQVIGRGTRTCGQKGLTFHPTQGWVLNVFVYDMIIPPQLHSQFLDSETTFDLYLKSMNIDIRLARFAADLVETTIYGSVDYELNREVHEFKIATQEGGARKIIVDNRPPIVIDTTRSSGQMVNGIELKPMGFKDMRNYIRKFYDDCAWTDVKMENLCEDKTTGGGKLVEYTPTQRFIKRYFTPQCPVKGMLLWHSTGTGKTCSAIATATSTFDPQGYTILWVTRTTLKNDIWKNMFDQICNEQIRTMIADGIELPEEHAKRMRMLSKAWRIRPISYKQFSNLVSKENNYYKRLVDINGKEDPLRKTLLIIDEAHKLYGGGDLSSLERPDMKMLHHALLNSYAVSGRDSVRLLLMTATPITESPIEIVKLINLCKPAEEQLPENFTTFSDEYLNEEGGFTQEGRRNYLDQISGHISYLNREKDARQFAQPHIKRILVPLVKDIEEVSKMDKRYLRYTFNKEIQDLKEQIKNENTKIETELLDLDSTRFYALRDICDDYDGIIQKGCLKIANKKIRELVNEARSHSKDIKDKIKTIREEIKNKNLFRKQALKEMDEKLKENPEELLEFQKGMYYTLKYECGKTINETTKFDDLSKLHPRVAELHREITEYDEQLRELDNELLLFIESHKKRTKELRNMLRNWDLNELEHSVVNSTLKDTVKQYRKTRKERMKNIAIEKQNIMDIQSKVKKQLRKTRSNLKESVTEIVRDKKYENKEKLRAEKELRKTLRRQGELRDEFKDGLLKDLMDKYKGEVHDDMDRQINNLQEEQQIKDKEKAEKQKIKDTEKAEKQKIKDTEKAEKQKEKDKEKAEKQKIKDTERAKKDKEKQEKQKNTVKKHQESRPKKLFKITKKIRIL